MKKSLLVAFALIYSSAAMADHTGVYVGADYTFYNANESGTSLDFGAVGFTAGYQLHKNFSLEGRAAVGGHDDKSTGLAVGLNNYLGIQGVGSYHLDKELSIYGTLGYGRLEAKASNGNVSATASDTDMSYGAGLQLQSGNLGMRLGVENILDKQGLKVNGFKVQGIYRF